MEIKTIGKYKIIAVGDILQVYDEKNGKMLQKGNGHKYYVDLNTNQLVKLEKDVFEREKKC